MTHCFTGSRRLTGSRWTSYDLVIAHSGTDSHMSSKAPPPKTRALIPSKQPQPMTPTTPIPPTPPSWSCLFPPFLVGFCLLIPLLFWPCRQSLDSSSASQHPSYRHSVDSSQLAQQQGYGTQSVELPGRHTHHQQQLQQQQQQQQASYRQSMDQASQDPYLTPPQYREAGPAGIEGTHEGQMLSYPPSKNAERRRSGSNVDFSTRRALAANLQMVEPYTNGVHRPTYTQR